jgi:uncharacterized protein
MELTLVLTHACNLRCSYCYAGDKHGTRMPIETGEKALRWAFDRLGEGERIQVGYFGGEPLLAWDLVQHFQLKAERLAEAGGVRMVTTLTTNGTLLDEAKMDWLTKHDVVVAVSLDGTLEAHDAHRTYAGGRSSFDDALRGARRALSRASLTELIAVVDPATVGRLSETARFLLDSGARVISLSPNYGADWDEETLATYASEMEKVGDEFARRFRNGEDVYIAQIDAKIVGRLKCGLQACDKCAFGRGEISVAPSGRFYPCERLVGNDDEGGAWCIGHIDTGVDEKRLEALYYGKLGRDPTCGQCEINDRCMNFCGCSNAFGSGDAATPGAFLCHAEQVNARVADRIAKELFWEGNPTFLRKFYKETGARDAAGPSARLSADGRGLKAAESVAR